MTNSNGANQNGMNMVRVASSEQIDRVEDCSDDEDNRMHGYLGRAPTQPPNILTTAHFSTPAGNQNYEAAYRHAPSHTPDVNQNYETENCCPKAPCDFKDSKALDGNCRADGTPPTLTNLAIMNPANWTFPSEITCNQCDVPDDFNRCPDFGCNDGESYNNSCGNRCCDEGMSPCSQSPCYSRSHPCNRNNCRGPCHDPCRCQCSCASPCSQQRHDRDSCCFSDLCGSICDQCSNDYNGGGCCDCGGCNNCCWDPCWSNCCQGSCDYGCSQWCDPCCCQPDNCYTTCFQPTPNCNPVTISVGHGNCCCPCRRRHSKRSPKCKPEHWYLTGYYVYPIEPRLVGYKCSYVMQKTRKVIRRKMTAAELARDLQGFTEVTESASKTKVVYKSKPFSGAQNLQDAYGCQDYVGQYDSTAWACNSFRGFQNAMSANANYCQYDACNAYDDNTACTTACPTTCNSSNNLRNTRSAKSTNDVPCEDDEPSCNNQQSSHSCHANFCYQDNQPRRLLPHDRPKKCVSYTQRSTKSGYK